MKFLSTKHLIAIVVAVFCMTGVFSGTAFAGASRSHPANSKGQANCSSFEIATKITSGGNRGKWYCEPKSAPQGGGGGNGGGGGGGGGAGISGSNTPADQAACAGLNQLNGTGCGGGQSAIGNVANRVVSIISYIAGIVAIIMIIVAGVKYTTSGGDAQKVSSAKTSLIYALIGLAVAALAQFLTHFVLSNV